MFLLAKYTSHKHPHHDELFSRLVAWFKGLDEATIEGFSIKL
jgi:hypothetical protein